MTDETKPFLINEAIEGPLAEVWDGYGFAVANG